MMDKTEFLRILKMLKLAPPDMAKLIYISERQAYRYASGASNIAPSMANLIRRVVKDYKSTQTRKG